MSYRVIVEPKAERQIGKLSQSVRERVLPALKILRENPRPHGCLKVVSTGEWRIRVGGYRIKYTIDDDERVVSVTSVSPRDDAY
jgi:mRNA interferase RelE/StbE